MAQSTTTISPFPPNTPDSVVFWWSSGKKNEPILFAKVTDMKVQAVYRLGNSGEGYVAGQSILKIIDFRGMKREQRGAKYEY